MDTSNWLGATSTSFCLFTVLRRDLLHNMAAAKEKNALREKIEIRITNETKKRVLGGWGYAENSQKVVFIPPWDELLLQLILT